MPLSGLVVGLPWSCGDTLESMVDVSSTMPVASATASSSQRKTPRHSAVGSDGQNLVSTFSDMLQASLKNTLATTSHTAKARNRSTPAAPATIAAPAPSDSAPSATVSSPLTFQVPLAPAEHSPVSFSMNLAARSEALGKPGATATTVSSGDPNSPRNGSLAGAVNTGVAPAPCCPPVAQAATFDPLEAPLDSGDPSGTLDEPADLAASSAVPAPGAPAPAAVQMQPGVDIAGQLRPLASQIRVPLDLPVPSAGSVPSGPSGNGASGASGATESTVPNLVPTVSAPNGQQGAQQDAQQDAPPVPVGGDAPASARRTSPGGGASSAKNVLQLSLSLQPVATAAPNAPARPTVRQVEGGANQSSAVAPAPLLSQEPAETGDGAPLFSTSAQLVLSTGEPAAANPGDADAQRTLFFPAQPATEWATAPDMPTADSAADRAAGNSFAAAPVDRIPTASGAASAIPAILSMPCASQDSPSGSAPANPSSSRTALQLRSEDGPELSAGLQAWNGGENAATGVARSGQSAGTVASSEMNVALRAEGLGAVQVHTRVTGDQVGAAITVEHHDAHAELTSDLLSLHQALAERQLRVENLSLSQSSPHTGAGIGDGAAQQHHPGAAWQRPAPSGSTAFLGAAESTAALEESGTPTAFDSNGRLSVQA